METLMAFYIEIRKLNEDTNFVTYLYEFRYQLELLEMRQVNCEEALSLSMER